MAGSFGAQTDKQGWAASALIAGEGGNAKDGEVGVDAHAGVNGAPQKASPPSAGGAALGLFSLSGRRRTASVNNCSERNRRRLQKNSLSPGVRGSSRYAGQVKRSLPLERSPLKYITSVLLSDFDYFIEKKFGLSTRVWVSILGGTKLLPRGKTLDTKGAKK